MEQLSVVAVGINGQRPIRRRYRSDDEVATLVAGSPRLAGGLCEAILGVGHFKPVPIKVIGNGGAVLMVEITDSVGSGWDH
jgi:hypothetical protein